MLPPFLDLFPVFFAVGWRDRFKYFARVNTRTIVILILNCFIVLYYSDFIQKCSFVRRNISKRFHSSFSEFWNDLGKIRFVTFCSGGFPQIWKNIRFFLFPFFPFAQMSRYFRIILLQLFRKYSFIWRYLGDVSIEQFSGKRKLSSLL